MILYILMTAKWSLKTRNLLYAKNANINLHVEVYCGDDVHHVLEAVFKALGIALDEATQVDPSAVAGLRRATHQTIRKVTDDLEGFGFNTAVAALMEYRNTLKGARASCAGTAAWHEAIDALLLMMAPLTPHISEELWARRGRPYSVHQQPWPAYDPALAAEDTFEMAVQVLGKVRARIEVPVGAAEAQVRALALADPNVRQHLGGKDPAKAVYVPGKLLNLVPGR